MSPAGTLSVCGVCPTIGKRNAQTFVLVTETEFAFASISLAARSPFCAGIGNPIIPQCDGRLAVDFFARTKAPR